MKSLSLMILLALGLSAPAAAQGEPLRLMSFNIRLPWPGDGVDYWPNRQEMVASMIRYHQADIVGLQEAFRSQLDDLSRMLPGYAWYGLCRTDGSTTPQPDDEFSALFYSTARFELRDSGTFWLSEHPDVVGVKGWDAALPRIASWGLFRDKQGGPDFYHFNTHFDHVGVEARANSARLLLEKMAAIAGEHPIVLSGDFNCVPTDAPYRLLTAEGSGFQDALFRSETPHHGPLSTWSGFRFPGEPGRRIDFIFVNEQVQVLRHAILSDCWSGRFPSDHLPVLAELRILE
jgi:endonuclease/exonuclease/phosphatase family metal-dependent hydrolase